MRMSIVRLIMVAVALVAAPCAVQAQGKPAAKDAVLYFIWPQNGATIKGGLWRVSGPRNGGPPPGGAFFQTACPHHLLIDVHDPLEPTEPIPQDKNHLH